MPFWPASKLAQSVHQVAATLAETVPQLQVRYEKVVEILLQRGAPASQVALAQRQSLLAADFGRGEYGAGR